jgi:hypothetical protein
MLEIQYVVRTMMFLCTNIHQEFFIKGMESKSGNKIKVRIVRHGGEKDIINDVTPNPVVWVENKGWFHC